MLRDGPPPPSGGGRDTILPTLTIVLCRLSFSRGWAKFDRPVRAPLSICLSAPWSLRSSVLLPKPWRADLTFSRATRRSREALLIVALRKQDLSQKHSLRPMALGPGRFRYYSGSADWTTIADRKSTGQFAGSFANTIGGRSTNRADPNSDQERGCLPNCRGEEHADNKHFSI